MNQRLQLILDFIQQNENLSAEKKEELIKAVKKVESDLTIAEFKLDRTEKVKRTTAILLEETIEELEQKRKSIEAQNKELEIESALERVRTMAMGMRKSEDLLEICEIIFTELRNMSFDALRNTMINIYDDEHRTFLNYDYSGFAGKIITSHTYDANPGITEHLQQIRSSKEAFSETIFGGKELETWLTYRIQIGDNVDPQDKHAEAMYYYFFSIGVGALGISTYRPISDERKNSLKRFRNIFELAYRRYTDISKAEAQAREAQIEAAMERVRAKAMAMHSSEDLAITIDSFFTELNALDVTPRRCGVGIIDKETRLVHLTATTATHESDRRSVDGHLKLAGHPVLDKIFESWLVQEEYHPVLVGNEILDYYKVMNPQVTFPDFASDETQYGYYFYFKEGGVFAWTDKALGEHDLQIFRRFTSVLSLTHRRYMDLKEAEFQAKEAIKQASLDRVRGQIASMRSKNDLQQITPLIWNELQILGIPFSRCGVFIIDEKLAKVQIFLSASDGHSLAMMTMPFDANPLTADAVSHWKKNTTFTAHWNKTQFVEWMQSLVDQGHIHDAATYQGTALPPESLYLHFVPFTQGMLYVGCSEALNKEEIDLVKSLAEAFAMAYARYDDFTKLELAKQNIESTLAELKSTQSQLIQSEKMASLGELTAGIAHEIQNPLNFVNNFSEVSHELIDEMKEELDLGNYKEAKEIAEDVKQNLEKIRHHGKRADGIVKGMLQHSRKESGKKEPTDINALADEYLRLAYHGLRAKDKSFNAELVTHFDKDIGVVNIIAQDIGRVILNLITNAFHAVNEKKHKAKDGFKPIVIVETKKLENSVRIVVSDNGLGIPENVISKVFQPFFTTKPTGQGTGLGLSLAYDIVKAHSGELTVETKPGEGTTFTVKLPH